MDVSDDGPCPTCGQTFPRLSLPGQRPPTKLRWQLSPSLDQAPELHRLLADELEHLRRLELEAIAGAPALPAGWGWIARFDAERHATSWVLRSTLLPVPVLEEPS